MNTNSHSQRKIIHIDMDCFYAAIEMRDRPELQHHPIAVGGAADRRGVLCTCNYQARQYGIHSAMSSVKALRLCPDLIILPPNMQKYRQSSQAIHHVFQQFTDIIEPLSLDEAFLDVTDNTHYQGSASLIAAEIRQRIFASEHITASAGIAANKFLAKIASDWRKPNGQYVIPPTAVDAFMRTLPVKKIFGVGKVMNQRLQARGIHTCADLQNFSLLELTQYFGSFGTRLYELARGKDDRPVNTSRQRKSVSVEHTFDDDLPDIASCLRQIDLLYPQLQQRLTKYSEIPIHKQFVKIKFHDFQQTTVENISASLSRPLFSSLMQTGYERQQKPVRLLGLGVGFVEEQTQQQLSLL